MSNKNLENLNIKETHDLIQKGEVSARRVLDSCLKNVEKRESDIHAFLEIFDDAFFQAEKVDKKVKEGQSIPVLAGIPIAMKDNILISGKKCSAGSKILKNYQASYDATVTKRLKDEGAVFVGRTNMDEFAMGSSTENSAFGPTKNPHDESRVPGGSSGGSAAAVTYGACLAALGSDTGGSIRQPASFCGLVGLSPTYGSVSRYGLMAMASSFDQIGPLARSVEDVEILHNVIKGQDPKDSTSVDLAKMKQKIANRKKRKVVGIPEEFFSLENGNASITKGVEKCFKESLDFFSFQGYEIVPVSIPSINYALEMYYVLVSAEISSNMARYDGVRYGLSKDGEGLFDDYVRTRSDGFGAEVKRRILLGTYVLSAGYYDAYYGRAQKAREALKEDFRNVFREVDFVLSPTTPTPAFKFGEKTDDPIAMYLSDIFTSVAKLGGFPAISLPCGSEEVDGKKLPLGLQLMAPWFEEESLFSVGKLFEKSFK